MNKTNIGGVSIPPHISNEHHYYAEYLENKRLSKPNSIRNLYPNVSMIKNKDKKDGVNL